MALLALKTTSIFVITLLVVLAMWSSQAQCRTLNEVPMLERHEQWMARYGRTYKDAEDKEIRFEIFKKNAKFIESFNKAGNKPYKLGLNAFADKTNEEFRASRYGYRRSSNVLRSTSFKYENVTAVPSSLDWRKKGAVTPVKDQGQCGNYQCKLSFQIF